MVSTMVSTITAGGYCRYSDDDQDSIEQQRRLIQIAADQRGWLVNFYVDEGYSAFQGDGMKRPDFQRMLSDLRAGRIQAVIFYTVSRLGRRMTLINSLIDEFKRQGIPFLSVKEGIDHTMLANPYGWVNFQLQAVFAEFQSQMTSMLVKDGMEERARQGLWIGPVPFGYRMQYREDIDGARTATGIIVPTEEAAIANEMRELYITGKHSYAQLADLLNSQGLTILDWKRKHRHGFGEYSIRSVFNNHRAYCGYVTCSGTEYPGRHEAIWTEEQAQELLEVRQGRRRSSSHYERSYGEPGILSGLVYCVACGNSMWYESKKRTNCYYRCSGIRKRICGASMAPRAVLEEEVIPALLRALSIPPETQEELARQIEQLFQTEERRPRFDPVAIHAKLKRLARLYEDGLKTDEEYAAELAALKAQLTIAEPQQRQLPDVRQAIAQIASLADIYEIATPVEKAALMRQLFTHFWIENKVLKAITPTARYLHIVGVWESRRLATPGRLHASGRLPSNGFILPPVWAARNVLYAQV